MHKETNTDWKSETAFDDGNKKEQNKNQINNPIFSQLIKSEGFLYFHSTHCIFDGTPCVFLLQRWCSSSTEQECN